MCHGPGSYGLYVACGAGGVEVAKNRDFHVGEIISLQAGGRPEMVSRKANISFVFSGVLRGMLVVGRRIQVSRRNP